ncbi:MAG: murein biosynthesis integral membrane protein MurJ [Candidatus Sericytochromatia bacterium]|nr:murein biosynthesis integral membrane protein MurJ [Candidatus Sericytochromatia bacterium]
MSSSLFGVASTIALLTLLSKGFGFGRELVIAGVFGASVAKDAYTAAYIIPSFSLVMLGGLTGPFHTAAQKVLATLRQQGREDDMPDVMASITLIVSLVLGACALLTYWAAPAAIRLVAFQASDATFDLAVMQLRIMAPLILLGGWIGILCGVSNDQGDFTRPSLSPLIASLAVILAVLLRPDPLTLAWGTLLGAFGQLILQLPAAWKLWGGSVHLTRLSWRTAEAKSIWHMLLPACVSSGVGTLSVIIGTNFASSLPAGSISVFDFANKLLQLPLGILMTALLIPLFPLLTRAVVAKDDTSLTHHLNRGLTTIAYATFPLMAYFLAGGLPLVTVVYQRGAFDRQDTLATTSVLGICALGIASYAARDLMVRVFYASNDGRTPLLVSVASLALTTLGMALVVKPYGLEGLAAITALVTTVNCGLNAGLLKRRIPGWKLAGVIRHASRAASAALAAGLATWAIANQFPLTDDSSRTWLLLVLQTGVFLTVYLLVVLVVSEPEMRLAWRNRLLERLKNPR